MFGARAVQIANKLRCLLTWSADGCSTSAMKGEFMYAALPRLACRGVEFAASIPNLFNVLSGTVSFRMEFAQASFDCVTMWRCSSMFTSEGLFRKVAQLLSGGGTSLAS